MESLAQDVNLLAAYLGPRDVDPLTRDALGARYGWRRADAFVLFGGSILAGGDVLARAMGAGVARRYVIVGGAGHTTETLRRSVRALCPELDIAPGAPEADIFAAYLAARHGLEVDALERYSTNCGNNITFLLRLLHDRGYPAHRLILAQDATMQRRMEAIAHKEAPAATVVNYATYAVRVRPRSRDNRPAIALATSPEGDPASALPADLLAFEDAPLGMWDMERYLTLLMGEIPRLRDDAQGYGPRGKGFLAHVDIPADVLAAWERLRELFPALVRAADPAFAFPR